MSELASEGVSDYGRVGEDGVAARGLNIELCVWAGTKTVSEQGTPAWATALIQISIHIRVHVNEKRKLAGCVILK